MAIIISVLRRIHLFCVGFSISAGCLVLAGMIAGYEGQSDLAATSAALEWAARP